MIFEMRPELDKVFEQCNEKSLDPKVTNLIRFATQLAVGNERSAKPFYERAARLGLSQEELSRAACLAACSCGPRVTETFASIVGRSAAKGAKEVFAACSENSLDERTHHLVSLAVCLASDCACASGHLIRLRELDVDEPSVHRAACIAVEEGGFRLKYSYIAHLENVRNCSTCVC